MRILAAFALLAALGGAVPAQSIVVPAAFENTRGQGGANTITRDAGNPRTYLLGVDASELSRIPLGAVINGLSFRAQVSTANPATWPPSNAVWSSYDVMLGNCIPLASWTTTIMNNFSGTPVSTRTGPLLIETGTYTNVSSLPSPTPNAWGDFFWDFHRGFTYTGGDLAMLLTHTGSNLTGSTLFIDWQTSVTTMRGITASSYQATTGTFILSPSIMRIHFGYGAGCPGSGGLVPNLVLTNNTTGGGNVSFVFGNAPASTVALLILGRTRTSTPLPGGCTLYTSPLVLIPALLNANGRVAFAFTVPPGVVGSLEAQGIVIDGGATAGFTATNGVTLTAR